MRISNILSQFLIYRVCCCTAFALHIYTKLQVTNIWYYLYLVCLYSFCCPSFTLEVLQQSFYRFVKFAGIPWLYFTVFKVQVFTQVEEMLISRSNPILQVTHAHGRQYKYYGHTIFFPQDISNIATSLPLLISYIGILVVFKCNPTNNQYELFVSRTCVLAALEYKMANNPYYKDVRVIPIALYSLPLESTNISPLFRHVNHHDTPFHQHSSSYIVQSPKLVFYCEITKFAWTLWITIPLLYFNTKKF